jgi:hypothetical protein
MGIFLVAHLYYGGGGKVSVYLPPFHGTWNVSVAVKEK